MPISHVFCGLCGQKDIALFDHVRNAHQIDIAEYEKQCPNAPLLGETLGRFVVDNDLVADGGGVKMQAKLFDVTISARTTPLRSFRRRQTGN